MYKRTEGGVSSVESNEWEGIKQAALSERHQRSDSSSKMGDRVQQIADGAAGVEASSPSSWDPNYPPHHAVNSDPRTFWTSTGLYPAEMIVTFAECSTLRNIEITSVGIRRMELMKCDNGANSSWEQLTLEDVDDADGGIQRLAPNIPFGEKAASIKLKIHSGYGAFVHVYKVSVTGAASPDNRSSSGSGKGMPRDLGSGSLSSRLGNSPKK
jgi:heat shock protein beta-11